MYDCVGLSLYHIFSLCSIFEGALRTLRASGDGDAGVADTLFQPLSLMDNAEIILHCSLLLIFM